MKRLALVPILLLPSLGAIAGECPPLPGDPEKAVHGHIAELRAYEYCKARNIQTSGAITVVIYTAEGACVGYPARAKPKICSNNWARYRVVRGH